MVSLKALKMSKDREIIITIMIKYVVTKEPD